MPRPPSGERNCHSRLPPDLAAVYQATDRAQQAEQSYRRALAIKEELLGENHADVAVTLNNLALLYKSQGRYDEAGPLYRRSLGILVETFGPRHPNVATCRENYAAFEQSLAGLSALRTH